MHTVKLDVTSRTVSGGVHATVLIDGQDTGKLYLTENEFSIVSGLLQAGAREQSDVLFECTSVEDEIDEDVFEYD